MARIYILHENDEWTAPLRAELDALRLPYTEWFLDRGVLDLSEPPPQGIFYNRMSASSHSRGHRYAPELTAGVLAWLESHGRRVLNGHRALVLEVSKVAQYAALQAHGIRTPRTVAAVGTEQILQAAAHFEPPLITKHNRAGKGLGVQLFRSFDALADYVEGENFMPSVDGVTLLQEFIESPDPWITRCEFVGGRFLYAVRADTSHGFELCPADVCQVGDDYCPAPSATSARFEIVPDFEHPLLERYAGFLAANDVHIAGVEFVVDRSGQAYTYDVNTNTNYNPDAERRAGVSGMRAIARQLGTELAQLERQFTPQRHAVAR